MDGVTGAVVWIAGTLTVSLLVGLVFGAIARGGGPDLNEEEEL